MQDVEMFRDAANCAAPWWRSREDELLAIAEDIAKGEFEMAMITLKQLTDEKRDVEVEIDGQAVVANFSYNLSGSGYIRGGYDELWFFRLEFGGVYVQYTACTSRSDTSTFQFNRYKTNGKTGGLGKLQEERAQALKYPLHLLMERELSKRGWRWVGFDSQCHNADMYRRPE